MFCVSFTNLNPLYWAVRVEESTFRCDVLMNQKQMNNELRIANRDCKWPVFDIGTITSSQIQGSLKTGESRKPHRSQTAVSTSDHFLLNSDTDTGVTRCSWSLPILILQNIFPTLKVQAQEDLADQ